MLPVTANFKIACSTLLALAFFAAPSFAAEPARPTPKSYYDHVLAEGKAGSQKGAGENFCWRVSSYLGNFVKAYEAWKDPAWLDAGVKSYDYAISQMTVCPDGYKGWVGPYDDKFSADVHVGDAIVINHMLEFAELVLKDETLKKTYGQAANRYVELAKRDFVEKWVSRGTWHEDGPYGGFAQGDMLCLIGDTKNWQKQAVTADNGVGLSLPFNKQIDCAQCLLRLYRITGDKAFRDRAQKIFAFMKSRMLQVGDYYVWNYWEPLGPWDVNLAKKDTRHWMNVHGHRNYQAGEIVQIVDAYNTGLVFDQQDIEHIINTNLKVMWNQDKTSPKFDNSNSQLPKNPETPEAQKVREEEEAKVYAKEGRAGCLWTALVPFSQTVRDLEALQLKPNDAINKAYFENVSLKNPPGFERVYASLPVTVMDFPFHDMKSLTVATVLPHTLTAGKPSIVLCKSRRDIDLEVAVYSADGKDKKFVLFTGKIPGGTDGHAGISMLEWDGADPAGKIKLTHGDYRVRWTTPDGYREFPVSLAE